MIIDNSYRVPKKKHGEFTSKHVKKQQIIKLRKRDLLP